MLIEHRHPSIDEMLADIKSALKTGIAGDWIMAEHMLSTCRMAARKAACKSQQARLSRKGAPFGRDRAWIGLLEP